MPLLAALLAFAPAVQSPAVDVPFRKGDNAIIVDATVNGHKVSLMFDTGFGGTAIVDSGVDLGKPTGKISLQDFVGVAQADTIKLKTLAVGSVSVPVDSGMEIVQQPADFSSAYGQHVDGIMGLSALKAKVFTIDFEHSKFVIHPDSYDISKLTPDNKTTFLQKLLPIGHSSLEMFVTTPTDQKMTLALDTGNAFYATTHRDVLERIGLWEKDKPHKFPRASNVNSGNVESWSYQMPNLSIFGVPTPPSVWDVIDLPSSSAEGDGTVGYGFLSNFNITVDYGRRRVWLQNWNPKIANSEDGDVGISAGYNPRTKRTEVYLVAPDSPAATAGVKEGDSILTVDGEDLIHVGSRRFRTLMAGPVGSTVRLAISHDNGLKRLQLKRASLVNVKG